MPSHASDAKPSADCCSCPDQGAPGPRRRAFALFLATALVAVGCLAILIRIEVLNRQAGDVLPRHEYFGDGPESGLVEWRQNLGWEAVWRSMENIPEGRPLTEQEQAGYQAYQDKAWANNRLRDTVWSWGLCQYPLAALLGVLACIGAVRHQGHRRWLHVGLILLAIGCLWRAMHLGYFESVMT